MDYKEKSISTLISSNHLMHRDQTDNIWFSEWMWRIHIKIPWNQLNAHLRGWEKTKECQFIHVPVLIFPNQVKD
jgi:hypothetical protein